MTVDLKTLAAKAFDTPQVDEFYAFAKSIWEKYGIPPHLLGGEDDRASISSSRNVNINASLSSTLVETGQYQKIIKLLERPEETGLEPTHISSHGYTLMHRFMRSNYNAGKEQPEQAIKLFRRLVELDVPHETYTKFGDQCIHLAARRSSPEILSAYLPIVKNVNALDSENRNALHCICTSFSFDGPHQYNWGVLMAAGSDPFNCDNIGHSITYTIEHFANEKINQYMKEQFIPMIKEAQLRASPSLSVLLFAQHV